MPYGDAPGGVTSQMRRWTSDRTARSCMQMWPADGSNLVSFRRKLSSPAAEKLSQLFATTARFVAVVAFGMHHGKTFRQVVDSDMKPH